MPSPKLIAVITALTCLAGAQGAYAAYTVDQLSEIERLIVSKDCGGLRTYIDTYPSLLDGDDALADELRNFANGIDSGLISCLAYRSSPSARNALSLSPAPVVDPSAVLGGMVY